MRWEDENYPGAISPDPESDYWDEPVDREFLTSAEDRLSFRIWSVQHVAARIEEKLEEAINRPPQMEFAAIWYSLLAILGVLLLILWRVW